MNWLLNKAASISFTRFVRFVRNALKTVIL